MKRSKRITYAIFDGEQELLFDGKRWVPSGNYAEGVYWLVSYRYVRTMRNALRAARHLHLSGGSPKVMRIISHRKKERRIEVFNYNPKNDG